EHRAAVAVARVEHGGDAFIEPELAAAALERRIEIGGSAPPAAARGRLLGELRQLGVGVAAGGPPRNGRARPPRPRPTEPAPRTPAARTNVPRGLPRTAARPLSVSVTAMIASPVTGPCVPGVHARG